MTDTSSREELARRIAALLNTRRAGQAVADYLEEQSAEQFRRAALADLHARQSGPRHQTERACSAR
ncbi:MAG: hypothetical protein ACOCYW_06355 [Roseicyclus sp.]